MKKTVILSFFMLSFCMTAAWGQSLSPDYQAYIETYKQAAVDQQIQHHIPACITLAQGLLESGAGKSELAVKANNHFGIKCHKDWTGATYTHDDETKNECFRSYESAEGSFNDHALFLMRPRYQSLFALDISDYKGWARGLKESGYATDPNYAPKLIKIIEDYNLVAICETTLYSAASKKTEQQVVDERVAAAEKAAATDNTKAVKPTKATSTVNKPSAKKKGGKTTTQTRQPNLVDEVFATQNGTVDAAEVAAQQAAFKERKINPAQVGAVDLYVGHDVKKKGAKRYVVANAGDTYKGIAAEFNIELRRILRYNRVSEYEKPQQGEKVYLNCKKP